MRAVRIHAKQDMRTELVRSPEPAADEVRLRLDTADGGMQGTTLSTAGHLTVHRPVRCRPTHGGTARARPGDHAAGAPGATHRWLTRPVHVPAPTHAASNQAVPIPHIGHTSDG